ncbi:transposase [Chryseobacterium rhizoplanae]|uniref:transposase n=1 Tax=Chryseobacterium rhizoplanae TaxID=1609531 RepID=UPI001CE28E49|nr:transposase [Chryseobacterium rhizoplanae]UCA61778.1 transposase [Chryseobacterium rhizoplanae]
MKNSKFSEVQIIQILAEQNQGKTVNEICREHGISSLHFTNGRVNMAVWMCSNFPK